jgi:hypothetical protein
LCPYMEPAIFQFHVTSEFFFSLQFESAIRIYILQANVVIITMSLWGVVQRRIPGTSDEVNWPVSFKSSVFFSYQ